MNMSLLSLGYFNGYFIVVPRIFLCNFHMCSVEMVVTWPDTKNGQKMKVVALQCSFPNLFELYSKVLPSWRYDVKDLSECQIFFFFFAFFSMETKPNNMISTHLEKKGLQLLYCGKFYQRRKVFALKGKLTLTDYKVYRQTMKVGLRLQWYLLT